MIIEKFTKKYFALKEVFVFCFNYIRTMYFRRYADAKNCNVHVIKFGIHKVLVYLHQSTENYH